ncbi:MAG: PAS domain S-box-containing protein, partial [Halobacteriales archaeon]
MAGGQPMKILLVDDDRETVTSIREQLAAELDGLSVDMVETGESAIHMIDESGDSEDDSGYDLVVSADELPGMDGLELLDRVKDRDGWNIPFVLIVGREYEDAAIDAFGLGADRILRKEGDTEAQHQVLAKGIAEEARRNDGRSKDRSEAQFREILAGADEAILLINDGTFVDCNDAAAQLLGYGSGDEIVGATPAALSPPTQPDGKGSADKAETMIDMAAQGGYHRFEWLHRRADGEAQLVDVSLTPIVHDGDRMVYCVWRPAAGKTAVEQETAKPTVDAPIADAAVPRETGIRALVVDADTHRGNVLAHDVQQHADEIDVTVVSTANEAIFSLDSQAAFDCLLVTTGVPDVDAVQLIEQVRRNRPILPTLLIVETADAEVVNRAIEAGASDYVVRRSAGDAPVAIAEKVRATVEQSRLQRGVQFSLQRYRTLSEYLPDPVAFVRDGQVLFCNERFVELAGRDRDRISDREFAETVVHPEDRDRIGRVIEAWDAGDDPAATETVRIVSPDGSVRHCEVAGRAVDAEGLSGVLVSFRDVTDRKRRETELELERALFETIPEALVESRTRSAFEGDVVDALHDQGYGLVCIGEPTEDVLVPRVGRGDSTYGDALDWS